MKQPNKRKRNKSTKDYNDARLNYEPYVPVNIRGAEQLIDTTGLAKGTLANPRSIRGVQKGEHVWNRQKGTWVATELGDKKYKSAEPVNQKNVENMFNLLYPHRKDANNNPILNLDATSEIDIIKKRKDKALKKGNEKGMNQKVSDNSYAKEGKLAKYPLGGALPIIASLLGNIPGMLKGNQQNEEAITQSKLLTTASNRDAQKVALADFKPDGAGFIDYYAAQGGKLATPTAETKGGKLKPLSSDMELAEGNKHNENTIDNTNGIKLMKGGTPVAEIEDEETIKDGEKVYSDQLKFNNKTYAENAKMLAIKKGKIEKGLEEGNLIKRNTGKRKLASIDKAENLLFEHQEISKGQQEPSNSLATGGKLSTFEEVAPYIDNITNAILTSNTPKVAEPTIQKQIPLKTKFNATPQLAGVDRAVNSAVTNIDNNTSNSNTARNEIAAVKLKGSQQKASINANKENVETQLHNQNTRNTQQVNARNLNSIENNNNKKLARVGDIQSRISANASDLASDVIEKRNFDAQEEYRDERVDIAQRTYLGDTTRRDILKSDADISKALNNEDYANQLLQLFKGTAEEEKLKALVNKN
jgi:hypothetical protein